MNLPLIRVLFIVIAIAYVVIPFDFDFAGLIGRIDDLAVILILWWRYRVLLERARARFREELKAGNSSDNSATETCERTPSPREVLNVPHDASREQIEKSYKSLLQKYHPDKVHHLGEEFQKLAHEKTLVIRDAYEKLTH